jgi:hypothetical protein
MPNVSNTVMALATSAGTSAFNTDLSPNKITVIVAPAMAPAATFRTGLPLICFAITNLLR